MFAEDIARLTDEVIFEPFAVLSSRWTTRAGTVGVSGGKLQASALGNWLGELLSNTGFEAAGAGGADVFESWSEATAGEGSIVDERTNVHAGSHACRLGSGNPAGDASVYQQITVTQGMSYALAFWARGDGTNAGRYVVYDMNSYPATLIAVTTTGVTGATYALVSATGVAPEGCSVARVSFNEPLPEDALAYFDDASFRRQTAVVTAPFRPSCALTWTFDNPAADTVTPLGFICRYTDDSNYWEVRQTPNTAGTDLQLIEVVAGVETVRASADVDWTESGTDQLRIALRGKTITVYTRKSGASTWTQALTYASATTGLASPHHGVIEYGTTARVRSLEVTP